jgi:hypothetical protein
MNAALAAKHIAMHAFDESDCVWRYTGLQVERLQIQVAELQEQLQKQADAAAVREQQARLDVQAAAEERFDIQLQQQQLKYERQIQVCAQPRKLAAPAGGSSCALTHVCK